MLSIILTYEIVHVAKWQSHLNLFKNTDKYSVDMVVYQVKPLMNKTVFWIIILMIFQHDWSLIS